MKDLYKSIQTPSEGVFKAKGSRFMALAYPVRSEEAIKTCIDDLKKQHHSARHHCYAWRLGPDMERYRVNDDGEPSGTAGQPIMGQIELRGLTDILVVVSRYFGGTLLGVSGLISAYRSAAADALDRSRIVELKVMRRVRVGFSYAQMNEVMKVIKELQTEMEEQKLDLSCSITLNVWIKKEKELCERLGRIEGVSYEML